MDKTDDMVKITITNRVFGVFIRKDTCSVLLERILDIQIGNLTSVYHQVDGLLVTKAKHAVHHIMFNTFNSTAIHTFIHQCFDFLFRYGILIGLDIEEFHDKFSGDTQ